MNFKPKSFPSIRSKTADRASLIISLHIVYYSGKMFMPQNNIFFRLEIHGRIDAGDTEYILSPKVSPQLDQKRGKQIKDKLVHFLSACGPWSAKKRNEKKENVHFFSACGPWSAQTSDKRQTQALSQHLWSVVRSEERQKTNSCVFQRMWSASKIDKRLTEELSQCMWSVVRSENRFNTNSCAFSVPVVRGLLSKQIKDNLRHFLSSCGFMSHILVTSNSRPFIR
jgi:hypothetical protein